MGLLNTLFRKSPAEVPEKNGPDELFRQVQKEYFRAEAEWDLAKLELHRYKNAHPRPDAVWTMNGTAFAHVNTVRDLSDPILDRLCSIERQARAARNNLQEQYASLLFSTGRKG